MNYKLLIVFVVIIILIILLLKENFEITDELAFNNLITNINNKNLEIENVKTTSSLSTVGTLEASNIGENIRKELMKEFYPVGSLFLSRKYYNLNNKNELINTPLNYGKWLMINDVGVIGTAKNDYKPNDTNTKTASYGNKKILVNHIPPHKHKYQWNPGRSSLYNKNYEYAHTPRATFTEADIYDVDGNKVTQTDFEPYGYYVFTYRKLEL